MDSEARILIIDDDQVIRKYLTHVLEGSGYNITSSANLTDGIAESENKSFDVVLLDVNLPDGNGLDALPRIHNSLGRPEVIIITGEGDPDGAELAIKSGAWDYIEKPLRIDSFVPPIKRALLHHDEKSSSTSISSFDRHKIIGSSPQINESILYASQAASSCSNTLITGETGTGKELFARAIHQNFSSGKNNFVVVDCTSLPANLVESILFGHEKGAFTGAEKKHEGLINFAHNGTLFLDEVGELPLGTQKSFLRVLQEKKIRPVGGEAEKETDFCLISATNRDLDELVQEGKFRKDLLFRLRTIHIELPALRDREGDINILATYFIDKLCELQGLPVKKMSNDFLAAICSYDWPGNVRELISVMENVVTAAKTSLIIYPEHLPVAIRAKIVRFSVTSKKSKSNKKTLPESIPDTSDIMIDSYKEYRENILHQAERPYLINLMVTTDWNIKKACELSELSRSRLYALLKKHEIDRTHS